MPEDDNPQASETADDADLHDEVREATESEGADDEAAEDDPVVDTEPSGVEAVAARRVANDENLDVLGVLSLHFPERTVDVLLDGDAAMRALTAFRQDRASGIEDILLPGSDARAAWLVFDYTDLLGMAWMPHLPQARRVKRMAVDPQIAA